MSETVGRAARTFRRHDSFEEIDEARFASTTTTFEATAEASDADGRIDFAVTVRVPTLSAAVDGDVGDAVAEGWAETFELRVADVGGVVRGDHDFDPAVEQRDGELVVEYAYTDINEQRGVEDAAAIINYVEGTYVQGIVPGYEYVDPVAGLLDQAKRAGQ
ncbi:hypothetical protein SAMN04488065_1671 [Haloplanus vescus]|uniref:Uncharacterized protein n=1 Tax=Haloplanus vescus TaxID=555874 RepID=A0A1H3Y5H6_9EURY|nr:DUF5813 family protein [Haloplanus vescus]SEA06790.1 hypothetical protein SAMN04488065_1671 [Haloplanus vescus]